jgi:transcriptional regulator with XRE-family HTH domain
MTAFERHPGDLGRRVRHRRNELGLTRADVADRSGLSAATVAYIEEQPAALDTDTVLRLAYALDLPDTTLLGSDADVPPRFGARRPSLDVLPEAECWRLLNDHGVGRIAFLTEEDDLPYVHPLNYTVRGHELAMRAREGSLLDAAVGRLSDGYPAGFEVDHIDDAQREGWSVLLRGFVRLTDADAEPVAAEPWAGGARAREVCLMPQIITGRRIFVD